MAARSAGRRWLTAGIVIVIVVAIFGALAFVVDWLARGIAEDAVKVAVQSKLPDEVDADVDVEIGGDWVLLQYLSGTMDEVTISDDSASINGVPLAMSVTASRVPTNLEAPVGDIRVTASLGPDALNGMLTLPGNDPQLSLGDGTLGYADSVSAFGLDLGYQVTAAAQPDGTDILLTPQDVAITSDAGNLDVSAITSQILGGGPIRVCVADYLPVGVTIESIGVTPEAATLVLTGSDLVLSGALANRGSCG